MMTLPTIDRDRLVSFDHYVSAVHQLFKVDAAFMIGKVQDQVPDECNKFNRRLYNCPEHCYLLVGLF